MKNLHKTIPQTEDFKGLRLCSNGRIDLNFASISDMMKLPDMDKQTANDIYDFAQDTTITDSYDLLELQSIDAYLIESWNKKICDMRIDLNKTNEKKLQRVKDIGKKLAKKIIEKKELFGTYTNINQLQCVEGVDSIVLNKLKSRVKI